MPNGASPARRAPERVKAGLMLVVNSCQRGDHSTRSLGASWRVTSSSSWRVSVTKGNQPRGLKPRDLYRTMAARLKPRPFKVGPSKLDCSKSSALSRITVPIDLDFNSIAHSGFGFGYCVDRQFQNGRGLQADGGKTPGLEIAFEVDYGAIPVKIDYVDGEGHGKSMNAVAGANPEATAITEVMFASAKEAAQAGPVSLGYREICSQDSLAGLVEGLGWHGCGVPKGLKPRSLNSF